jgi:tetratricopeptide (TPR) repeat protein
MIFRGVCSCSSFEEPMLETAKILRFPARPAPSLGALAAARAAAAYLEAPGDQGRSALLRTPEVLLSVCSLLRERVDASANEVLLEATELYRAILSLEEPLGVFDERDYFLGETSLLAGIASRVLGKGSDCDLWFERAEAGFRHTVNPAPLLASVSYQRLALRCEAGRYKEVVELAPMLATSFKKLGMPRDEAKCILLQGIALKQSGSNNAAEGCFESLTLNGVGCLEPTLVGIAFANLADLHAEEGRYEKAAAACQQAFPLITKSNRPAALAHLKNVFAEILRRQGKAKEAIAAYCAAIETYESLGMVTFVAYLRVVLAEALLEQGQARQAEWQILAAIPTIDEARMVPEGFAAMALLRESVRQKNANPKALSEVRQYLRAQS